MSNKYNNPSFSYFDWDENSQKTGGLLKDLSDSNFKSRLWCHASPYETEFSGDTFYGITKEPCTLTTKEGEYDLDAEMYFQATGDVILRGGKAVLVERVGYKGWLHIGGPCESQGRLKYIDGCTDSLLIPPTRWGDPCFNLLHFPSNIDQTYHTHPSDRVGLVLRGEGECKTPFGNIPLYEGMIFIIHYWVEGHGEAMGNDGKMHPVGTHAFRTEEGKFMDVIAYHPDSDFGPQDEEHPMLNRTIVDGVSAKNVDSIRTTDEQMKQQ